ncbi:uncharacterized protein [Venturia canescens]|uniref:uncharacterized protein n=1 Tax=Venturia canescens TaxID=32260 RepID=UPI001C9C6AFA|nr:uncharacterized protein LOC122418210 [Venturia canescens]
MNFVIVLLIALVFVGNVICSEPEHVSPGNTEGMEHNQQLPSRDELLNMLDSMTGLSDDEKENLRQDLLRGMDNDQEVPTGKRGALATEQTLLLFALLGLLALIFLFFGYKLYKSLTEKERLRNEKKRLKESKKKNR